MKTIFWLAVSAEGLGALGYLYRAWTYRAAGLAGDYIPDRIFEKLLIPAAVLIILCLGGLIARYYFQSPKAGNIIALLPVIFVPVALLGMIFASIFLKGRNH